MANKCSGFYDDNADGNTAPCSVVAGCGFKGCPSIVDRALRQPGKSVGTSPYTGKGNYMTIMEDLKKAIDTLAAEHADLRLGLREVLGGVRKLADSGAIQNRQGIPAALGWCPWCERRLDEKGECSCL